MTPIKEDPAAVDQPEPEDVLSGGAARTGDHIPADGDDREVELDDPATPEPPIDEDDRDPGRRG